VIRLRIELRGRGYTFFRALEAHPSAHIVDALLLTDARDMRTSYGALNAGPKGKRRCDAEHGPDSMQPFPVSNRARQLGPASFSAVAFSGRRWHKMGSAARLGATNSATNSATNQKTGPHKSMYFQLVMRLIEEGIAALRGAKTFHYYLFNGLIIFPT